MTRAMHLVLHLGVDGSGDSLHSLKNQLAKISSKRYHQKRRRPRKFWFEKDLSSMKIVVYYLHLTTKYVPERGGPRNVFILVSVLCVSTRKFVILFRLWVKRKKDMKNRTTRIITEFENYLVEYNWRTLHTTNEEL